MGIVPPNLIPPRRRKPEVKDEHPMQEEWDRIAEQRHPSLQRSLNPGLDVIYGKDLCGGQSNRMLLELMKIVEGRI